MLQTLLWLADALDGKIEVNNMQRVFDQERVLFSPFIEMSFVNEVHL